ncbi:MAG: aspartyl protease family protein [Micrococcales bacterium]|nr:aspartyl protease family protein [Micrococcales bacterium]
MEETRQTVEQQLPDLKERFSQDPFNPKRGLDYANGLFQLGCFNQSKETLKQLEGCDTNPEALWLLGRIEYLHGNYAQAEVLSRKLADQFPDYSQRAKIELGSVYYQTNQYHRLEDLALPDDPESELSIAGIHQVLGDKMPYQVKWAGPTKEAILPFKVTNPLPLIQIDIGGQLHNFIIDTGAGDTIIDHRLIEPLGIQVYGQGRGVFAAGVSSDLVYGLLDSMTLGNVTVDTLPVVLLPSSTIEELAGVYKNRHSISGLIGVGLLRQFLATMDYPAKRLVLHPRSAAKATNVKADRLPFVLAGSHMIISQGVVNGKDMNVFFDSGLAASVALLLPSESVRHANIDILKTVQTEGVGGGGATKLDVGIFRVNTLKLGALTERKRLLGATGIFPEQLYNNAIRGFYIDALLSHQYLKGFVWTIDFEAMEMTFAKKPSLLRRALPSRKER